MHELRSAWLQFWVPWRWSKWHPNSRSNSRRRKHIQNKHAAGQKMNSLFWSSRSCGPQKTCTQAAYLLPCLLASALPRWEEKVPWNYCQGVRLKKYSPFYDWSGYFHIFETRSMLTKNKTANLWQRIPLSANKKFSTESACFHSFCYDSAGPNLPTQCLIFYPPVTLKITGRRFRLEMWRIW